jgi:hypothetical protein
MKKLIRFTILSLSIALLGISCSTSNGLKSGKQIKVYVSFTADVNRNPVNPEVMMVKCEQCTEEEKKLLREEALRVVREQFFTKPNMNLQPGKSYTLPINVVYTDNFPGKGEGSE